MILLDTSAACCVFCAQMVSRDQLTPELLKKVSALSLEGYSRRRLAKYLCETLNWRGPSGQWQLLQARKLLRELERNQQLQLQPTVRTVPKAKAVVPYQRAELRVEKLRE